MQILMTASGLPLGINFIEILIHLINFAILILAVRFLLYKPIKKFMQKRSDAYTKDEEAIATKQHEADALKEQYEKLVEDTKQNAVTISKETTASALIQADEIISDAKKEATEIIKKAKDDMAREESTKKEELSGSVSELAVNMASQILQREVKPEDNDKVIDSIIEQWKK